MTIVTSYDWHSDTWTLHNDNPARLAFREAVAEIAEKAKATLPECNGRVDRAVKIVLAGDCELLPDGSAKVASQSNGTTKYFIVNGECSCKDYKKAPSFWCQHRIAAGLAKRAYPLAKTKLEQQINGTSNGIPQSSSEQPQGQSEPVTTPVEAPVESEPIVSTVPTAEAVVQSEPEVSPIPLPEAPASANVYITIAGRNVQLTLRDHDEEHLLSRMEKLLERFPSEVEAEPAAGTTPPDNWCPIHQVPMKRYSNAKGAWFSHRLENNSWCNGKGKGK